MTDIGQHTILLQYGNNSTTTAVKSFIVQLQVLAEGGGGVKDSRTPVRFVFFAEILRIENFRIWIMLRIKVNSNDWDLDETALLEFEAVPGEVFDADTS